jgi:hypothetical protein
MKKGAEEPQLDSDLVLKNGAAVLIAASPPLR